MNETPKLNMQMKPCTNIQEKEGVKAQLNMKFEYKKSNKMALKK